MKDRRMATGRAGEDFAAEHLQQLGYVLEQRNWRCRSGEIDLIARDQEVQVFIEVRTRTHSPRFGLAVEAVTPRKCRQVREIASIYLKQHGLSYSSIRFDAVAVTLHIDGSLMELKHIQAAF